MGFSYPGRKRRSLLERDGPDCPICGVTMKMNPETGQINPRSPMAATIDHVYPHSKGGTGRLENLQLLCTDCNQKKSDHLPLPKVNVALQSP